MKMDQDNEIGGALCEEILSRRLPISGPELARKLHIREEKVLRPLQQLCSIGIIAQVGDKYIAAELAQKTHEEISKSECVPQQTQEVAIAAGAVSRNIVTKQDSRVSKYSVDEIELFKTQDTIQKILQVFTSPSVSMKAHVIAKQSGLGESRSAVNRYLYFLEKHGILAQRGKEWTLVKTAQEEEVKVMAAQLAKKPQGKRRESSTSSTGCAPTECDCPNSGGRCNHYHFTKNVHNHQYNIQVGDNNVINFGADEPRRSDT